MGVMRSTFVITIVRGNGDTPTAFCHRGTLPRERARACLGACLPGGFVRVDRIKRGRLPDPDGSNVEFGVLILRA